LPLLPEIGLKSADAMFRTKRDTKERIASLRKLVQGVFMTKPVLGNNPADRSNDQQFQHTLVGYGPTKTGFSDITAADGISQVARYWLAGLVKHARGLTALCCPTVNCSRRLHRDGPSAPLFSLKSSGTP